MTGVWATKAADEAKKIGKVHIAATTKAEQFARVPRAEEIVLTPGAAYVHMTSNNTIYGTEWKDLPDVGDLPLVSDTSSDMFSRPIDVERHALIYAGAQKNLGPAGVTVVIIRDDLLTRSPASLPATLSYAVQAENGSMYNTPPVFAIYMLGPRHAVAHWTGRPRSDRENQSTKGGKALRGDRQEGFIAALLRKTAAR